MSKMISVASGFQYSVNIGYDLNNDTKLKNFIPTRSSLALLEDILLSTNPASTERARVLIGAYGKGKSHIVLTILAMLMKRDRDLFKKAMPKIAENPRLAQLVENYYESDNKILPVIITYYSDKSFDFVVKTPPVAIQVLEAAKVKGGSAEPNRKKVGEITWDQVKAIAEDKMVDLNCFTVESAMRMVAGTARSMGITVKGEFPVNN